MPPRRRRRAAAVAAAAAADATEARQLDSFVTRFWDAQGSDVGDDPDERVQYLLAAAKKILDAAGDAKHHLVDDAKERVGVATAMPRGNLFVQPAQDEFVTAARMLASETDWDLAIGIPYGAFLYHPHALLHLFAAVIGMLAPNMRVRIVGHVDLHKRIMARLKTRQYVTLTETSRGAFDAMFDATEGSASATWLDQTERSIEKNNALLLYIGPVTYTIDSCIFHGLWLRCLMLLRRRSCERITHARWFDLVLNSGTRWRCSGHVAVLCDMILRLDPADLTASLETILLTPTTAHAFDETVFRNAILASFGDGSNSVRLWPALRAVAQVPHMRYGSYRERFQVLAKAQHDAIALQTQRAAIIRAALHPPTDGVILMALAVVPLVVAYLDHALDPIPPEWLPVEHPRPAKSHAGVKRKAPSPDLDTGTAAANNDN